MAYCRSKSEKGVSNFHFGVQGSRPDAGPDVYDREINNLITLEHEKFRSLALSPEGIQKFDDVKTALSDKISIKPRTLSEKSFEFVKEINSSKRDLKKLEKKLKAISAMTFDKFMDLFEKYIVGNGKRKISSQVGFDSNFIKPIFSSS
jgi:secreted Zn-dependent insulinase-like peptidase